MAGVQTVATVGIGSDRKCGRSHRSAKNPDGSHYFCASSRACYGCILINIFNNVRASSSPTLGFKIFTHLAWVRTPQGIQFFCFFHKKGIHSALSRFMAQRTFTNILIFHQTVHQIEGEGERMRKRTD